ncbi:UPF0600 protein C5orf51 -like protein [Halotydeus destructor]|nr:UPF0600 protein C5orf51 -like protein [Halotydeus destructor]
MDSLIAQLNELKVTTGNKTTDDPSVKVLIETYAKAVCDCTFYHENFLSEKDFKDTSAEGDVRHIINLFDAVANLCVSVDAKINPDPSNDSLSIETKSVINVLGLEFAECIHWRKGSLIYAFCNCKINHDSEWLEGNQATFLNFLSEGIGHLQSMLDIRKPKKKDIEPARLKVDINSLSKILLNDVSLDGARKTLLCQEQMLGEKGQELEQLEEVLEHQQEINHEALLDIQQQLHQQPHLEDVLQEVQMEVQAQQQDVLDQQEDQEEQKKQLHDKFLELQLQQQHLQSIMRQVSKRMSEKETQATNTGEPNTLKLVEYGIYSDPHLLAAMYSSEMAYWYLSYSSDWDTFSEDDRGATLVRKELAVIGKKMATLYRKAVKNCGLEAVGWSCERAVELLSYFRQNYSPCVT